MAASEQESHLLLETKCRDLILKLPQKAAKEMNMTVSFDRKFQKYAVDLGRGQGFCTFVFHIFNAPFRDRAMPLSGKMKKTTVQGDVKDGIPFQWILNSRKKCSGHLRTIDIEI